MKLHNVSYGANVIEYNGSIYMFDAGTHEEATRRIIPFLRSYYPDVTKIKKIFISHYHYNHIEGITDIAEHYDIGAIYSNGTYSSDPKDPYKDRDPQAKEDVENLVREKDIPYEAYKAGDIFNLGGLVLTAWSPLDKYANNFNAYTENPNGLTGGIMCLEYGNFRALFGGDITQENELLEVLGSVDDTEVDVWFAPHHGDPIALKDSVLGKIKPKLVVLESLGRSTQSVDILKRHNIDYMWMQLHVRSSIKAETDGTFVNLTPDSKEYYRPKGRVFMT